MNEFVVRNGLIVSGSTYLEAISQSNEAYILSYDSVTNEVAYMPTSSVVVTVPGADTQIIYNNGGVFGASSNLVFSGSRVGIGSANPAYTLDVVGAVNASGGFRTSDNVFTDYIRDTSGVKYISLDGTGIKLEPAGYGQTVLQAVSTGVNITGNVGIGTTNPQAKLDVSGSIALGGTAGRIYYPRRIVLNSVGDFAINNNADSENLFYVDTTKVWVSGSLGVGTASPAAKLDLAYSTNPTTATPHIILTTGGTSKQAAITAESFAVGGLVFSTGDGTLVDRMTILRTNGNVGIGTTNPSHKLTVLGAVSASSFTGSFSGTSTNAISASFAATASSADAFYVRSTATVGSNFQIDSNGDFYQKTTGGAAIWSAIGNTTYPSYAFYNDLGLGMYRAAEDTLAFTTSGSERVRITSDGNLAINSTSTSGYRLYVNGSTWINGGTNFVDGVTILRTESGASEVMRIASGGNVGIGTTNPLYKLHVVGSTYVNSGTLFIDSGEYIRWGNSAQGIRGVNDTSLEFVVGSSTRMYVSSSGNVGIGITSPANRLSIGSTQDGGIDFLYDSFNNYKNQIKNYWNSGTDTRMDFNIGNSSGVTPVTIMSVGYGGNVGIGTTSPQSKLHISGAANGTDAGNVRIDSTSEFGGLVINENTTFRTFLGYGNSGNIFSNAQTDSTALRGANYLHLGASSAATITINGSNDNVGIGTTNPLSKLQVNKSSQAYTSPTASGALVLSDTGGTGAVLDIGVNTTYLSYIQSRYLDSTTAYQLLLNPGGGSVGIGTTAPTAKLDVNGDTLVTGSVKIAAGGGGAFELWDLGVQRAYISMTGTPGLNLASDAEIQFQPGNATAVTFASSGNVGIGTTNPTAQLTLSKGAGNQMLQLINSSESGFKLHIHNSGSANTGEKVFTQYLGYNDNVNGYISFHRGSSGTDGYLSFGDNGGERVRFSNGGNVGIGTTSSGYKLEVNGTQRVVDNFYLYNTVTNVASNFTNQRGFGFDASTGATEIAASTVPLQLSRFSTTGDVLTIRHSGSVVSSLRTDGGASFTGNVGIGINSPSYKLHVSGGNSYMDGNLTVTGAITAQELYVQYISSSIIYSTGSNKFGDATNDIQYFTGSILQSGSLAYFAGNVGIGTASPVAKLDIVGSHTAGYGIVKIASTNSAFISIDSAENDAGLRLKYNTGDQWLIGIRGNDKLQFNNASDQVKLVIQQDGNVGIGTTSPSTALQVVGAISASGAGYIQGNLSVGTTYNAFAANIAGTTYVIGASVWVNDGYGYANASSGGTGFFPSSSTAISINSGGNTRMFIASGSGNVGIGTTNPNAALNIVTPSADVTGNAFAFKGSNGKEFVSIAKYGYIRTQASDTNGANMHFVDNGGTKRMEMSVSSTAMNWYSDATATNFLTFQHSTGNVGINTTSPGQKLQIDSPLQTEYYGTDSASPADTMNLVGTGAYRGLGTGSALLFSVPANTDGSNMWAQARILGTGDNSGNGSAEGAMFLQTRALYNPGVGGSWNWRTNMVLRASGNVGIGTTNPAQKLSVVGSGNTYLQVNNGSNNVYFGKISGAGTIQSDDDITFRPASTELMRLTSTNVGIGTTSPSAKLDISGSTEGRYLEVNAISGFAGLSSGSAAMVELLNAGDGNTLFIKTQNSSRTDAAPLAVWTNNNPRFLVRNDGNVGIGTTNPTLKLDVIGNARIGQTSNSSTDAKIELTSGGSGYNAFIDYGYWDTFDASIWRAGVFGDDSSKFKIQNTGAGPVYDVFVINGTSTFAFLTGSVGIGTASPGAKLQITGGTLDGASLTDLGISSGLTTGRLGTFDANSLASISTRGDASSVELAAGSSATYYTGISATANNATSFTGTLRFFTSGSEKVRITPSGNVGIGTTNPSQKLDISAGTNLNLGVSQLSLDNFSNEGIGITFSRTSSDDDLSAIGIIDSDKLGLFSRSGIIFATSGSSTYSATSEKMRITENGNVGIGTTNPSRQLELVGSDAYIQLTRSSTSTQATLGFNTGATNDWLIRTGDGSTSNLQFYSYGTSDYVMTIARSSGNVGIGTTNPTSLLHVGPASTPGSTATPTAIQLDNQYRNAVGGNTSLKFYLYKNGNETYGIGLNNAGGIEYHSGLAGDTGNYQAFYFGNSEKIRFKGDGNVGIGTTAPVVKLHVADSGGGRLILQGVGGSGINWQLNSYTDGKLYIGNYGVADYVTLTSAGNVGIGTTSPAANLHIQGSNAKLRLTGDTYTSIELEDGGTGDPGYLKTYYYGSLVAQVGAGGTFFDTGNVGIGTTNPSQKLSVYGDIAIANSASIQESRIGKYQSGSLGSGTHTIASVSVTGVDAVFFDYVIKNSTTDMRAGTVMAVTNGSTVEYTDISTADIGDTSRITMISDVSGGNIRLRASIDTGAGSWTIRTLLRTL